MDSAEAVLKFLSSVGPRAEAQFYLDLFRRQESFAAIAVEGSALVENGDAVATDLRFLQALELTPIVVIGLHEPATEAHCQELTDRLQQMGVRHRVHDSEVEGEDVAACLREGDIVILRCAEPDAPQRLARLGALLTELQTRKLILLRNRGGLRPGGQRISLVNLSSDLAQLAGDERLTATDRQRLEDCRRLVFDLVAHRLVVAITSPMNLLRELFTMTGAGTLLRGGAHIERHGNLDSMERPRLELLLQSSFGKAPLEAMWQRPLSRAYLADDYRGVALLEEGPGAGYLSKFAVDRQAQGEGIGRDLWQAMTAEYPRLIWRARAHNSIAPWYEQHCDGRLRAGGWTVYFRGLELDAVPDAVRFAVGQPSDFAD